MIFLSLVLLQSAGISLAHSAILGLWARWLEFWGVHTENGCLGSAFTRPWPNFVELIIAQVAHITSSPEPMGLSLSAHLGEHTKNKVLFFVTHTQTSTFLPQSFLLRGIIRVTPLSTFVARILLWYSSSPCQAWTCRILSTPLLPLASSSLPLGRKARSWEIKGTAWRPHERQRRAAVLNSPKRLFQSEQPDQQRRHPQGRRAGRRSLRRFKVLEPKLGEKL